MFKIWVKIIANDKIIKNYVYENENKFEINRLYLYMAEIANELDVETPILLKKHYEQFYLFNTTTFNPSDFINDCGFDKLIIENVTYK